ncbi:hypothetical protein [Kaistia sp. MMO-174]|uniref:hypothetical protein n=1 Tax=Kaistia sp. MMO-174 TaxID=3081256 RepID=UPI0030179A4B
MPDTIFRNWSSDFSRDWGRKPIRIDHTLSQNDLFSKEALAELIERYPIEHYSLMRTSSRGEEKKIWRRGEVGGLSGHEVMAQIASGGLWLQLRELKLVDKRYNDLLQSIYAEVRERVPGFHSFGHEMGILISSPNAKAHYHADLPGQALWQILGRKRVYIYPAAEPYLPQDELEKIALTGLESALRYDPEFDRDALVLDLEPGQMLTWELNAPHRVENHDELSVSMTTEHWTEEIRREQMMTVANGILRKHFGVKPKRGSADGPAFWAKAALQAGWRRSPWYKREQRKMMPVDFRLAPGTTTTIVDIPAYVV